MTPAICVHDVIRRAAAAALLSLTAAACGRSGDAPAAERAANVLLVTLDTTRADHLGCYGYQGALTPALDHLASQGVRFANAFSPAPITLVSHASLLTGLPPFAHGLRDNGAGCLAGDVETFAEFLHDHGYHTAAVVGAVVLAKAFGLDQGFDSYDDLCPPGRVSGSYRAKRAVDVADAAIRLLAARPPDRPFFFWLHFFDAHDPYEPPEPQAARFKDRPYDGEIAYVDTQLERVLAALDQAGQSEHTVVAVTADHGESLGEHGEATHGFFVYDATQHVPLLLRGPRIPSGAVCDALVDLTDVMPTVIGLIGIGASKPGTGRDLARLIERGEPVAERAVYLESYLTRISMGWSGVEGLRTAHTKLIEAPQPELYDLAVDPGETSPLGDPARMQALRAQLAELKRRIPRHLAGSVAVSDADRQALEALGYVGAGRGGAGQELDPRQGLDPKRGMKEIFPRLLEARRLQLQGDTAAAARLFETLLGEAPDDIVARDGLAACQINLGQLAAAEQNLKQLLQRRPDMKTAWFNLAVIAMAQSRTEAAIALLERVLRLDDASIQALDRLAQCHEQLRHYEAARAYLTRALELLPPEAKVRSQLVDRLAKLGSLGN
ncbi:MAG: sulfatase-like hydrolase/transferase [Planctomycetota bacterium]